MRHLRSRPGHRHPLYVTDPDTGRIFAVPQGGDENDDKDDEGGEGEGEGEESDESEEEEGGSEDDGEEDSGDEPKFTQKDLDDAIDKRIARERKKHEREVNRLKRQAAKEGDGDPDDATKATQERLAKATGRAIAAEVRAAAVAAGVPADKVKRFAKLVDADADELVDEQGDIDTDAIEGLVEDTLDEWPEFKPGTQERKPGASGSESHGGDRKRTKVWTRKEIAELSEKEYDEHREEIEDQVKRGLVK